jgi:hypothetical protein
MGLSAFARNPINEEYHRSDWGWAVPAVTEDREQRTENGKQEPGNSLPESFE